MPAMLVYFQWPTNTGYAIGRLEPIFAEMALRLVGDFRDVHFAYPRYDGGPSRTLPPELKNFVQFNAKSPESSGLEAIGDYVKEHGIDVAFGFDQPPSRPSVGALRRAGAKKVISYWGAPVSSLHEGPALWARRLQYRVRRHCPDHYIFETEDMRRTATRGLGVPASRTSVVPLGVDTDAFRPKDEPSWYAHDALGIDRERKIVFYSGHMERRKGVHVIVEAAVHLVAELGRRDLHFVFLGNKAGNEKAFDSLYRGTGAEAFITFAGYREDVAELQAGAYLAVIASTGWDSHTMTALEVASTGLPLLVSDIPGIRDAIADGTGFRFRAGDHRDLAAKLLTLADNMALRDAMGAAARARILRAYTRGHQVERLVAVVRHVLSRVDGHQ